MGQVAEKLSVLDETYNSYGYEAEDDISISPAVETLEKKEPGLSGLFMKPIFGLKQSNSLRPANAFLILALAGIGVFAFLFTREFNLRKQTLVQLVEADHKRINLEETVSQLRTEVAEQRKEIEKLMADLKTANEKVTTIDTIQESHRTELARVTESYEGQLKALYKVLDVRNELIQTFESNLESIRKLMEQNASAPPSAVTPIRGISQAVRADKNEPVKIAGAAPGGKVVMVNSGHRFVIVSMGPTEGAEVGRFIQIQHEGKSIGDARIERVYQTLSAATVLSEDTLKNVRPGDAVYLGLS